MEKTKTTMSVREMQELLGIKKTDAYWLVHKNQFETVLVSGRMRIRIDSFEEWYANQEKHKKIYGSLPGQKLQESSYSVRDMAQLLGVREYVVYDIIRRDHLETFPADTGKRIPKEVFEDWYGKQQRYRTKEDRKRDAEAEANSYTMPEIARLLLITRKEAYYLLEGKKTADLFEIITVAGKKRVTKESFEAWYRGQSIYRKLEDRPQEEQDKILEIKKQEEFPRLRVDPDKKSFDIRETAILLDLPETGVRDMIRRGELDAKKYGHRYLIRRDELTWWVTQQKLNDAEL